MKPKVPGCCTKCDVEVYEVIARDPETREPRRLGPPLDNAVRMTFILIDGTRMDLTFCKDCADALQPCEYPFLWQRVMQSWIAERPGHPWAKSQTDNGIIALFARKPWKEV